MNQKRGFLPKPPPGLADWRGQRRERSSLHRSSEPQHTRNSSLSKAPQAPLPQQIYRDKCGALSAENTRAGRSAPRRLSITQVSAPAACPKLGPQETPPAESTARAGVPGKTSPPARLQPPLPQHHSPRLTPRLAPAPTKTERRQAQPCDAPRAAKSPAIKGILGAFPPFLQHHLTVQKEPGTPQTLREGL